MRAYDASTQQKPVLTYAGIDSALARFPLIPYPDLDTAFIRASGMGGKFAPKFRHRSFYKVRGTQVFRFVVDTFRVYHFLSDDDDFFENLELLPEGKDLYWLMDKKVLYKMLDLMKELEKEGYDRQGIQVYYGHRFPEYNYQIGGSSRSEHMYGRAIDLDAKDLNRDGRADSLDKQILLRIAEDKVIRNSGGVGRYPGTQRVHIDTRGHRARWDSYTPWKLKEPR